MVLYEIEREREKEIKRQLVLALNAFGYLDVQMKKLAEPLEYCRLSIKKVKAYWVISLVLMKT